MKLPMLYENYEGASGFLFIGDPHCTSRHPGRRLESDQETILVTTDKLDQAIDKANELNAVPVILGDLLDKAKDSKAWLMTRMLRSLKKAKHTVLCIPGNHDLLATDVTDDTALAAIAESGLLKLFPHASGPVATFIFDGVRVGLGGTVHDAEIPESVLFDASNGKAGNAGFEKGSVDKVVWVTHHDIAFDGAYPGSQDPFPIAGCELLVNGHMHRTKPSIKAGDTWWVNPGNIYRQTIADADHVPSVWFWEPTLETPAQHVLRFIKDVFDWTGKMAVAQAGSLVPDSMLGMSDTSEFVSQLKASISSEMPATHDGSVIVEDIEAVKEAVKPSAEVISIIDHLQIQPLLMED